MRFHITDPHADIALLELRASRICCEEFQDFLSNLGAGAGQVAGEVAGDAADTGGGLLDLAQYFGPIGTESFAEAGLSALPDALGGVTDAIGSGGLDALYDVGGQYFGQTGSALTDLLASTGGGGGGVPGVDFGGSGGAGGVAAPGASLTSGAVAPVAPVLTGAAPGGVAGGAPWGGETLAPEKVAAALEMPATPTVSPAVDPGAAAAGGAGVAGGAGAGKTAPGGIAAFFRDNGPLMAAIAGGAGIGKQLLSPSVVPGQAEALANAKAAAAAAQGMIPAVTTGELPAGAKLSIQNALNDTTTAIKAKYAGLGLAGSTMERQDIAAAGERARAMEFDMAKQLTQLGLNAASISNQMYQQIANVVLAEDRGLQDALSAFAQAMGLGGGLRRVA